MDIFDGIDLFAPVDTGHHGWVTDDSRALVASNGSQVIILDWMGPAMEYLMHFSWAEAAEMLDDGNAPRGLSIWEGDIKSQRDYWGEWDEWAEGTYRPLTAEEWTQLQNTGKLWNHEELFTPERKALNAYYEAKCAEEEALNKEEINVKY